MEIQFGTNVFNEQWSEAAILLKSMYSNKVLSHLCVVEKAGIV